MVVIPLHDNKTDSHRYNIQQSNDPDSFIEFGVAIRGLEVNDRDSQLREFVSGHKKSNSDLLTESCGVRRLKSMEDTINKEQKIMNCSRINIKTQETEPVASEEVEVSSTVQLKKIQKELMEEK
jgi:hypothetical protein